MRVFIPFIAILLAGCGGGHSFKVNHDYPLPPAIKRLTAPGACTGGGGLAAVSLPVPHYPASARRKGRQGWVVVSLDVTAQGTVNNVAVRQSAPGKIFDRSALRAVRQWVFRAPGGDGLHDCLVFIDYRLGAVRIGQ